MDNPIKKQFNKKRLVLVVITAIMFIGVIIMLQRAWTKAGIFAMSNNVGDVYLLDDTLYYGSRGYGICAYNEKTATYSILIKNTDNSFIMDDEYIYYRKGNKDYKYNIHTGQKEKTEKRNQEFYYTEINPKLKEREIFKKDENIPGDISYAVFSEKYLYAKHHLSGGYIGVYNVEDGKAVVGANGECEKILEYSYSPINTLMNSSWSKYIETFLPTNMIWLLFILLPMPFLIVGAIFVKIWKGLKNN